MLLWGAAAASGGGWNVEHLGYGLLILGGLTEIVESSAQNSAQINNTPYNQTAIGSLLTPIESVLPFSLGWTLVVIGAALIWVLPMCRKG